MNNKKLLDLILKWETIARSKFTSAENQKGDGYNGMGRPTGKQFIEHGAICYSNCAFDLLRVLAEESKEE